MPKRVESQDKRIPAVADIEPSNEYVTLQHLIAEARVRSWSDAKIGRMMLKHFGYLLQRGKKDQHGECDICDEPLVDAYNVAQHQNHIVHRNCRSWSGDLQKSINKALKAYQA